jgi:uncharacterized membrane protein YeaQ/YmgE (transglycosylase-associated protein family)
VDLLLAIISWIVFGLIVGALARLIVPGRQHLSIAMTIVLGVVGSLAGGFVAWLIFGGEPLQAAGWIMSLIGAVVVLWAYVAMNKRHSRV